ncbi:hypothetical protein H4582DRAFT_2059145 [Lactarius indigo]|nr:hypothetical protein H4582DRAFT_2059145 [Lactarius indigo]
MALGLGTEAITLTTSSLHLSLAGNTHEREKLQPPLIPMPLSPASATPRVTILVLHLKYYIWRLFQRPSYQDKATSLTFLQNHGSQYDDFPLQVHNVVVILHGRLNVIEHTSYPALLTVNVQSVANPYLTCSAPGPTSTAGLTAFTAIRAYQDLVQDLVLVSKKTAMTSSSVRVNYINGPTRKYSAFVEWTKLAIIMLLRAVIAHGNGTDWRMCAEPGDTSCLRRHVISV